MFSFLNKKKKLAELIPDGYVDIHSHVLFGIDDGAQTVEDSAFIMESMINLKFAKSIATPHTITYVWENTREGILNKYDEVRELLPQLSDNLKLQTASEYLMDEKFLEILETSPLLTLKDKIVLVEMSYINPPIQLYDIIYQIQIQGYTPVLAHPERYNFYHQNFKEYKKLKNAGCLFQMNLLSSVGYYGREVSETAQKLLDENYYDFTGSDIHHEKHIKAFNGNVVLKNEKNLIKILENNSLFK